MTQTSRRAVLRASVASVVLAPFAWAIPADAAMRAQRLYRRHRFTPLRGRAFLLKDGGRSWKVRLAEVRNLPGTSRGDDVRFRLTFTSRVAGPTQGTYVLSRTGFRATSLFLVPSDPSRRTYNAIVNRPS